MNLCRSCRCDFASVAAFDRHRIGTHAYTFAGGITLDPSREDGRRCMDEAEMIGAGMELDGRGRWRIATEAEHARRYFGHVEQEAA